MNTNGGALMCKGPLQGLRYHVLNQQGTLPALQDSQQCEGRGSVYEEALLQTESLLKISLCGRGARMPPDSFDGSNSSFTPIKSDKLSLFLLTE